MFYLVVKKHLVIYNCGKKITEITHMKWRQIFIIHNVTYNAPIILCRAITRSMRRKV